MEDENNLVNEPQAEYQVPNKKKTITFYNSFQEMEEDRWRYLASTTYEQRLQYLEERRKVKYREHLQADGTWPPLKKIITIIKNGKE
jgi:hypothetical protein